MKVMQPSILFEVKGVLKQDTFGRNLGMEKTKNSLVNEHLLNANEDQPTAA